jgi:tetratricopeptide (TPR) repeat protein
MGAAVEQPGWVRWLDRYGWVVVVAGGLLAYHNSFDGQFFLDDFWVLPGAEDHPQGVDSLIPTPLQPRWLGAWSFVAGFAAVGSSLAGIHAVNLGIHLLAGVTLWSVVARTLSLPRFSNRFSDRTGLLATATAGLWVVHPLTTAAVTYLTQRFESQMGLFVLISLWATVRGGSARAGRVWWFAAAVVAAAAATATKESAIVLPFVLFIFDRLFLAGSWRGAVRRWPLYLALCAAQVSAFSIIQPTVVSLVNRATNPVPAAQAAPAQRVEEPLLLSGAEGFYRNEMKYASAGFDAIGMTPWMYLRSQPEVILHYLRLVVVPHPLVLDYHWPVADDDWHIWPPGLVILALLGASVWAVARGAAGGFLGAWFFAFLAVSSSVVPIVDLAFEHRMYLPLAACVAALVLGADGALARLAARMGWRTGALKLKAAVALICGAALTALTVARNEDYRDPVRMYTQMLSVVPDNGRVWNNLGTTYARRGQYSEAAESYRNALRYSDPRVIGLRRAAWFSLIQVSLLTAPPRESIGLLTEFAADDPNNPSRRFLLANARFNARDFTGSAADYRAAIAIASRNGFPLREPMVFGLYAQALQETGDREGAVPIYYRALECPKPPPVIRNQLGQILTRLGRYPEADAQFRAVIRQAPQAPNGPYNLGVLLLHQRKPDEAAHWFREALQRDRSHAWALLGLAQALAESGHAPEARQKFAEATRAWNQWPQVVGDLAWRLVTVPDPHDRYGAEGLRLARLLTAGVGDNNPGALDVLAAALAEVGQFGEAERTATRAAELARAGDRAEFAAQIESRRSLYAQNKPYRVPQ